MPRERPGVVSTIDPEAKPDGADVPLPRQRPSAETIEVAAAEAESAPPIPSEKPAPPEASGPDAAPSTPQPREKPTAAATAEPVPVPDAKPASASPPLPAAKPEAMSAEPQEPSGPPVPAEKPAPPGAGSAPVEPEAGKSPDDKPSGNASPAAGEALSEPANPPEPPVPTGPPQGPPFFADDGMSPACAAIEEGRVSGRPLKPKEDLNGCLVEAVYAVSSVGSDRAVALSPEAELNCAMTDRIDSFVEEVIEPAAREILETELTGLGVAGSYVCRTRNGQADAKQSEHGFANAVDVARFVMADGRTISVLESWAEEGAAGDFLRTVHEKACGPFTTVIGPDGDEYHQDHFHFDLQKRGADGQTTFCQ